MKSFIVWRLFPGWLEKALTQGYKISFGALCSRIFFCGEGCVFAIPRAATRSIQASYRGKTSMLGVAVVEDEDVLMVVDKEEGKRSD